MKLLISSLSVVAAVLFISGCATTNTVPANAPTIRLVQAQERFYEGLVTLPIEFPAGDYTPVFADKDGIYYRAPAPIEMRNAASWRSNPPAAPVGGIFVPYASSEDRRQMGWTEQDRGTVEPGTTWLNDHTPIRLFRISRPLDYVTTAPAGRASSSLPPAGAQVALRN